MVIFSLVSLLKALVIVEMAAITDNTLFPRPFSAYLKHVTAVRDEVVNHV